MTETAAKATRYSTIAALDDEPAVVEAFSSRLAGMTSGALTALPIGREWVDRA